MFFCQILEPYILFCSFFFFFERVLYFVLKHFKMLGTVQLLLVWVWMSAFPLPNLTTFLPLWPLLFEETWTPQVIFLANHKINFWESVLLFEVKLCIANPKLTPCNFNSPSKRLLKQNITCYNSKTKMWILWHYILNLIFFCLTVKILCLSTLLSG